MDGMEVPKNHTRPQGSEKDSSIEDESEEMEREVQVSPKNDVQPQVSCKSSFPQEEPASNRSQLLGSNRSEKLKRKIEVSENSVESEDLETALKDKMNSLVLNVRKMIVEDFGRDDTALDMVFMLHRLLLRLHTAKDKETAQNRKSVDEKNKAENLIVAENPGTIIKENTGEEKKSQVFLSVPEIYVSEESRFEKPLKVVENNITSRPSVFALSGSELVQKSGKAGNLFATENGMNDAGIDKNSGSEIVETSYVVKASDSKVLVLTPELRPRTPSESNVAQKTAEMMKNAISKSGILDEPSGSGMTRPVKKFDFQYFSTSNNFLFEKVKTLVVPPNSKAGSDVESIRKTASDPPVRKDQDVSDKRFEEMMSMSVESESVSEEISENEGDDAKSGGAVNLMDLCFDVLNEEDDFEDFKEEYFTATLEEDSRFHQHLQPPQINDFSASSSSLK